MTFGYGIARDADGPGRSLRYRVHRVITIASAILLLAIVIGGLATGRLHGVPFGYLFGSVLLFLTLPYYFTSANDYYSYGARLWLLFLAVLVIDGGSRGIADRPERNTIEARSTNP